MHCNLQHFFLLDVFEQVLFHWVRLFLNICVIPHDTYRQKE